MTEFASQLGALAVQLDADEVALSGVPSSWRVTARRGRAIAEWVYLTWWFWSAGDGWTPQDRGHIPLDSDAQRALSKFLAAPLMPERCATTTRASLTGAERAAFVELLEQEHGWAAVTAAWTKHTWAETKATDREEWLIDAAAELQRRLDADDETPALRARIAELEARGGTER